MEKSIVYGLDYYISQMPGAEETDAKSCSPLVLAYIGDCVFDLVIKTRVVGRATGRCTSSMKRQVILFRRLPSLL